MNIVTNFNMNMCTFISYLYDIYRQKFHQLVIFSYLEIGSPNYAKMFSMH